jgi:hypothetical protein
MRRSLITSLAVLPDEPCHGVDELILRHVRPFLDADAGGKFD